MHCRDGFQYLAEPPRLSNPIDWTLGRHDLNRRRDAARWHRVSFDRVQIDWRLIELREKENAKGHNV